MTDKAPLTVADVMTRDVITIDATATVRDAINLMREHHTSSLVVERRDESDEYGLIVVRGIAADVLGKELSPDRVNVYEVMTKPVLSVAAGMQVKYAVRLLVRHDLLRALVVDDKRHPVGIVTLRDMVLKSVENDGNGD